VYAQLGGRAALDELIAACRQRQMGVVLDIVPNHMAVLGVQNAWWFDVLENGPASRHAACFDIDWQPVRETMRNRLLVPVLAAPLGEVIDQGQIRVAFRATAGTFVVTYLDHVFPVEPGGYAHIFSATGWPLDAGAITETAAREEFSSLLDAFAALPAPLPAGDDVLAVRERDRQVNQRRLARLCARQPQVQQFIEAALQLLNAAPARLAGLLQVQPYRLAFWRVSGEEINYRRFFDVNDLAALRMEDAGVFAATHVLVRELWQAGAIDGVRVDHADGLYDPAGYFRRLRTMLDRGRPRPWIVAEKILGPGERVILNSRFAGADVRWRRPTTRYGRVPALHILKRGSYGIARTRQVAGSRSNQRAIAKERTLFPIRRDGKHTQGHVGRDGWTGKHGQRVFVRETITLQAVRNRELDPPIRRCIARHQDPVIRHPRIARRKAEPLARAESGAVPVVVADLGQHGRAITHTRSNDRLVLVRRIPSDALENHSDLPSWVRVKPQGGDIHPLPPFDLPDDHLLARRKRRLKHEATGELASAKRPGSRSSDS
jgi:hypothetical protein